MNKATADAYTACFDATTELELSTVQTGLPPPIFGRITALPDEEQFQCKIPGGLGWCDKSTGVESHNNKPLDLLRSLHFVNFLSEAVRHFASRFRERAADVRKKHGAMLKINAQHTHPPKVWKRMHAQMQRSLDHNRDQVILLQNLIGHKRGAQLPVSGCYAQVNDSSSNKWHTVDMQKLKYRNPSRACDCGYGFKDAVPCCHSWLVSRKLGLDMQTLLHSALAWDTWYSQYHNDEGSIPMPVPVESDILRHKHRANPNLRLPFVQKAKKGRPRKHKRIVSVFEQVVNGARKKSRAQVTCQLCFRTGHNKKSANCPYNIREEERKAREREATGRGIPTGGGPQGPVNGGGRVADATQSPDDGNVNGAVAMPTLPAPQKQCTTCGGLTRIENNACDCGGASFRPYTHVPGLTVEQEARREAEV